MLGALARWLRAAGYDAHWREGIEDAELIALAKAEKRIILTADTGIMNRNAIIKKSVTALYVPLSLSRHKQVAHVLRTLNLPRRAPRCMACGGSLVPLDRQSAREVVPPAAFERNDEFYRCQRCGKVYWPGTHWNSIDRKLAENGLNIDG